MTVPEQQTKGFTQGMRRVVVMIAVIGFATPVLLCWWFFDGAHAILPARAKELLRAQPEAFALVDVRSAEEYADRHIDGAYHWPLSAVMACRSAEDVPAALRGKTLLLICNAGFNSTRARRHLSSVLGERAGNVRGGIQEWISSAAGAGSAVFDRWKSATGQVSEFPFRQSPWHEQALLVASGMGIKPAYTLVALVLFIVLWRSTASDLVGLRRAMLAFFVGENCCAANYYIFGDTSYLMEYLHSFGMLLCFGFTAYAVLQGIDHRILMFSEPDRKCAALSLCARCAKHSDAPCGLERSFLFIIPACMVLACMPLTADLPLDSYNTKVFGTFYNYTHRAVYQLFEKVYCPTAAVVLLGAALAIMLARRSERISQAKVLFACGLGPLGFGLLRMILAGPYIKNQVWFVFWEEMTELLFVLGAGVILWIFRHSLFRGARPRVVIREDGAKS